MEKTKNTPKGGRAKLVVKILVVVVLILAVAQLLVLGILGGIGPFGFIQKNKIKNHPGNKPEYDFSQLTVMENSPLEGGKIAILGSSVAQGAASQGNAVGEYLAARFGCTLAKEAVGGTTLVDNGKSSYVQRLYNLDASEPFDLFICQLSTNDATKHKPLGEISDSRNLEDFDTSTVTGAMEYIICYAQETWDCPVVFFTGSRYDSEAYGAMVDQLLKLQEKWGIGVLDLWSSDEFNDIPDDQRAIYMNDGIHPTKAGYRDWWGPEQERQLLMFLSK